MPRQTKQRLCKCPGGNFIQARQTSGPTPRPNAKQCGSTPKPKRMLGVHAFQMMVDLVCHEYRCAIADSQRYDQVASTKLRVDPCDRSAVEDDACRPLVVFGEHNGAAKTGIRVAFDDRHIQCGSECAHVATPSAGGDVGSMPSVFQRTRDVALCIRSREAIEQRVARKQPLRDFLIGRRRWFQQLRCHTPRAPCTLIKATGVSGASPSSSLRLIASAWSSADDPGQIHHAGGRLSRTCRA